MSIVIFFNENLVVVHKIKETLLLDKSSYVGMCILDLSKRLMYDFHTDSLCYETETEDIYRELWEDKTYFTMVIILKIAYFLTERTRK